VAWRTELPGHSSLPPQNSLEFACLAGLAAGMDELTRDQTRTAFVELTGLVEDAAPWPWMAPEPGDKWYWGYATDSVHKAHAKPRQKLSAWHWGSGGRSEPRRDCPWGGTTACGSHVGSGYA